jgi:hypothetical protein
MALAAPSNQSGSTGSLVEVGTGDGATSEGRCSADTTKPQHLGDDGVDHPRTNPSPLLATLLAAPETASDDLDRIVCAQRSTAELLDGAVCGLRQFNSESDKLLATASDQFAAHTLAVMELRKAVAQLEQRVVLAKGRAMRLAAKHEVDVGTLIPERDDDY